MDVWECDLMDVQAYAKYNDNQSNILPVKDVFSKFLYLIPVKTKGGPSVASAFRSIIDDPKHLRRLVWIRSVKGKEFLNKHFGDMLRGEGLEFQVCKTPEVKCAVVERTHRTIRDKLHKYFTHKKTFSYIDVLPKFSGLTMTRFIRRRACRHASDRFGRPRHMGGDGGKIQRVRVAKIKFSFGQHVRINNEKMMFAMGGEQNFNSEIFRNPKVIERRPRAVYELEDLNKTAIEVQFYQRI